MSRTPMTAAFLGCLDDLTEHFQRLSYNFGFHSTPGVDLLFQDETILFTNSTIVGHKLDLIGGALPEPGLSIIQSCVRTHNLKAIREASADIGYMSCFTQAGLLGGPDAFAKILLFLRDYLEYFCGRDRLLYKTKSTLAFNEKLTQGLAWAVQMDSCASDYYEWQYGMPGVRGNGVTFSVKGGDGGYRDIGNFIEIVSGDVVLGYEFGFGLETLLSRLLDLDSPFDVCVVNEFLGLRTDCIYRCKLLDSLMLASTLCALDITPDSPRRGTILKRAVIDLIYLCRLCEVPMSRAVFAGTRFLIANELSTHRLPVVLEAYEQKIDLKLEKAHKYISYARSHNKSSVRVRSYCVERLGIPEFYYQSLFRLDVAGSHFWLEGN